MIPTSPSSCTRSAARPTVPTNSPSSPASRSKNRRASSNFRNPRRAAGTALGGNPDRLEDRGVGASDGALVTAASRRGVDPSIRTTLAEEDEALRYRKWLFSRFRIFGSDEYYRAYEDQTIDRQGTRAIWRRAGVPTPSAPPER